ADKGSSPDLKARLLVLLYIKLKNMFLLFIGSTFNLRVQVNDMLSRQPLSRAALDLFVNHRLNSTALSEEDGSVRLPVLWWKFRIDLQGKEVLMGFKLLCTSISPTELLLFIYDDLYSVLHSMTPLRHFHTYPGVFFQLRPVQVRYKSNSHPLFFCIVGTLYCAWAM
uniref:Uncharacterized protein n=1 Tax=Cyprinodon variegatus TaxID=28743 RepID=A0A3Q2CFW2_CYPVA